MISTASPPASADTYGLVVLREVVRELLVGRLLEDGLLPQVEGQVGVNSGHGGVGRLGEVAEGAGGAAGGGVAVVDTRHLQQLLGDGGRDDAGAAGGGDEAHPDGAALAGHLAGHGVRPADLVAPEAAPHGHDGELGEDDRAADGGGHLLGALYAIFPCLLLNNCSSLNCTALRDILPFFAGGSILLLSSVSFSETVGS